MEVHQVGEDIEVAVAPHDLGYRFEKIVDTNHHGGNRCCGTPGELDNCEKLAWVRAMILGRN